MLRRLEPASSHLDMLEMLFADERRRPDRPWVMLNMVESIDGATAVRGGASALNDEDDRSLFLAMRAVADVILVGAQTVRSEGYGPVHLDEEMNRHRREAGLQGAPRLVVLTRSLNVDPGARIFSDPEHPPLILTGRDADRERVGQLAGLAEVTRVDDLDGGGIVAHLSDAAVILCEGGPTINSQLIASGLVDEINVTVSPMVALGESQRIAHGDPLEPPLDMRLDRVVAGDRSLFLRYVRD